MTESHEPHELTAEECASLLRSHDVGRVAVSTPTGPHIVPVNYTVSEDSTIIRTTAYSLLGTYGRNTMLAFEIDGFDHGQQRGWSVQARGRGEVVADLAEVTRLRSAPGSQPWAGGSRSLFLRMRWSELTGRRLGSGWNPLDRAASTGSEAEQPGSQVHSSDSP